MERFTQIVSIHLSSSVEAAKQARAVVREALEQSSRPLHAHQALELEGRVGKALREVVEVNSPLLEGHGAPSHMVVDLVTEALNVCDWAALARMWISAELN